MALQSHLTALESSGLLRLAEAQPELEYFFRHALVQEAAYESLVKPDRRRLHLAVGETLERLYPDRREELAPNLARHFDEAGDPRAVEYFRRAGDNAARRYANAEAIEHYTRALDASAPAGRPATGLLRARGLLHEAAGNFDLARADHEAALASARAAGDRRGEWRALLDLGFLWASRDYDRTGEYFRQGLDLARRMDDPLALGHSLNRTGNWHLNVDQPHEAFKFHLEALAIFERIGDPAGIAETSDLLGMTSFLSGDRPQGMGHLRRAVGLFRQLDDRAGLISSLTSMSMRGTSPQTSTMVPSSEGLAEASRDAEEALRLAREIGWPSAEAYALFVLAFNRLGEGRYADAFACAEAAHHISEAIQHRQWLAASYCALGSIHHDLLLLPEARTNYERAHELAHAIRSRHWIRSTAGFLASLLVETGELDEAGRLLDAVIGPATPPRTLGLRLAWCARVELALARGDADFALRAADELLACAPQGVEGIAPRVWHLRGLALAALGRDAEARSVLDAAADFARSQGARPMAWRLHAALARLHRAAGRAADAERHAEAARAIVEDLAAEVPDPSFQERFRRQAQSAIAALHHQPQSSVSIPTSDF